MVHAGGSAVRISAQRVKFDQVVSSLSSEFAAKVRDLLLKPPTENPYQVLKEQLIRRTAASEQRKLQQLFTTEELGDRKPTQLLRRMQQLLGDRTGVTDGSFLQELFLQRLSPNVRIVLASTLNTIGLEKLAEMADKIVEVATPSIAAAFTPTVPPPPPPTPAVEQLRAEVTRLEKLIHKLAFDILLSFDPSLSHPYTHDPHIRPVLLVPPEIWWAGTEMQTAMLLVVKRPGRPLAVTSVAGLSHSCSNFYACHLASEMPHRLFKDS